MEKHFTYTLLCDQFEKRKDSLSRDVLDWIIEHDVRKSKKIQSVCSNFITRFQHTGATEVLIYGAGDYGRLLFELFSLHKIKVLAFIDLFKTGTYLGRPIISPQEYVEKYSNIRCVVSIISASHANRKKVSTLLNEVGANQDNIYYLTDDWWKYPKDELSITLSEKNNGTQRWFSFSELFHSPNEVFVNIGAYNEVDVENFFAWKQTSEDGGGGHVYCFDIMPKQCELLRKKYEHNPNVTVEHMGCGKENGYMNFTEYAYTVAKITSRETKTKVQVRTVDSLFPAEKVTYLKMCTVGTEPDVLEGARQTIKRCKPIIGVAIFVGVDLWWQVPKMIWEIDSEYQIYMRQYPGDSTLLYALPRRN